MIGMFIIAPNFDQQPGIHRVLTDASLPPDRRVDDLYARTTDADWEEAADHPDESVWQQTGNA
jgi:hypothetical protein